MIRINVLPPSVRFREIPARRERATPIPQGSGADTLMPAATGCPNVESDDPTVVRVLAVTVDDVLAALEANERRDAGAVLRVTPPFSGRMRARLHLEGTEREYDDPAPVHISPERFLRSVPPFPSPDETEDELRSDPAVSYSPARHRKRHESAVEDWRERLRGALAETATIETPDGPHTVRVAPLG